MAKKEVIGTRKRNKKSVIKIEKVHVSQHELSSNTLTNTNLKGSLSDTFYEKNFLFFYFVNTKIPFKSEIINYFRQKETFDR